MLKTGRKLIELRLAEDWNNVKNTVIDRLVKAFHEHPHHFFTEHDIHSVLYNITKEELQLSGVLTAKTIDRHEIALVHHEYPTPFRCSMKGYSFEIKHEKPYRRGHYDLVILNPEFIENTKLEVVYGKDYHKFTSAMQNTKAEPLIWACEVLFLPGVKTLPRNSLKIIEQDALKVKESLRHPVGKNVHFCKVGSVLVFTGHTAGDTLKLRQQIAKLSQKHTLEVTLATASPEDNRQRMHA